ncbi:MAG: hypothetical protein FWG82_02890 [Oscillospiraceae bacterium]|nr:hypothetical protein [Oscillospiraceae bacterium]
MSGIAEKFLEDFNSISQKGRKMFYIAFAVACMSAIVCIAMSFCAGRYGDYFLLMNYAEDLGTISRAVVGIFGIAGVILAGTREEQ